MIVAEGRMPGGLISSDSRLQWGRNLIVAEGIAGAAGMYLWSDSFNGAAT